MLSEQQLVQIYILFGKANSIDEIADATGISTKTVSRALLVQRELRDGIDFTQQDSKSGYKSPTLKNARSALDYLRTEQLETSARPGIVRDFALKLSRSLGVPISRDVSRPGSEVWTGHGLLGPITQEPRLHMEKENQWRIFNEDMPQNLRTSFTNFQQALMSYGRSIKEMHRVCASNMPEELSDPSVVRSPELAKEAAVLSMLHWLRQPQDKEKPYSLVAGRDYLPKSKDTTTLALGAWVIETRQKDLTEKLYVDLLESSEIILVSREAERFTKNYQSALVATETLRSGLFDLAVN